MRITRRPRFRRGVLKMTDDDARRPRWRSGKLKPRSEGGITKNEFVGKKEFHNEARIGQELNAADLHNPDPAPILDPMELRNPDPAPMDD